MPSDKIPDCPPIPPSCSLTQTNSIFSLHANWTKKAPPTLPPPSSPFTAIVLNRVQRLPPPSKIPTFPPQKKLQIMSGITSETRTATTTFHPPVLLLWRSLLFFCHGSVRHARRVLSRFPIRQRKYNKQTNNKNRNACLFGLNVFSYLSGPRVMMLEKKKLRFF